MLLLAIVCSGISLAPSSANRLFAQVPAGSWAVVVSDRTPVLRKVENSPDAISALLWSGQLVTVLALPPKPAVLDLKVSLGNQPPITGSGVLDPVRVNLAGETALMFRSMLKAGPAPLPSRAELCARIHPAAYVGASVCEGIALFMVGPVASGGAQLAALVQVEPEKGRLVVFGASAGRAPVGLDVSGFEYRGWRALDNGRSVILSERFIRRGALTGFALATTVVSADGSIKDDAVIPIKTAEPVAGVSRIVEGTYRVMAESPLRIVIDLTEESRDINTGASTGRQKQTVELHWNGRSGRFETLNQPLR